MNLTKKAPRYLAHVGIPLLLLTTLACVSAPSGDPELGVTVPEEWTAANPEAPDRGPRPRGGSLVDTIR